MAGEPQRASVLGKEAILSVAESLGQISNDVAEAMAPEVEFRLRDIVQEARKFMLAAKRECLTTDDINLALRLRKMEPLYGFGSSGGTGPQAQEMPRFCRLYGAPDVFYLADREVALSDVVAAPFPPLPREPGLRLHWLAVEGRQPVCADNPPPRFVPGATVDPLAAAAVAGGVVTAGTKRPRTSPSPTPGATGAASGSGGARAPTPPAPAAAVGVPPEGDGTAVLVPPAENVLTKEELSLLRQILEAVRAMRRPRVAAGAGAAPGDTASRPGFGQIATTTRGGHAADADATSRVEAEAEVARAHALEAALHSIATEPSTAALAPFLAKFFAGEVSTNLTDTNYLLALVRFGDALLRCPQSTVERYLQEVIPKLMTCMVNRKLAQSPTDDHWQVRDAAARAVARACARFGSDYPSIQPRVTLTLVNAIRNRGLSLPAHYGAVAGLAALGPEVVHCLLLPEVLGGDGGARAEGAGSVAGAAENGMGAGAAATAAAAAGPGAVVSPATKPNGCANADGGAGGGGAGAGHVAAREGCLLAAVLPELSSPSPARRLEALRVYSAILAAAGRYLCRHRFLFAAAAGSRTAVAAVTPAARRAVRAQAEAQAEAGTEARASAVAVEAAPGASRTKRPLSGTDSDGDAPMGEVVTAPAAEGALTAGTGACGGDRAAGGAASAPGADALFDADVPAQAAQGDIAAAAAAATAASAADAALAQLLPQLGTNYVRLYGLFGEAVLPYARQGMADAGGQGPCSGAEDARHAEAPTLPSLPRLWAVRAKEDPTATVPLRRPASAQSMALSLFTLC